MQPLRLAVVFVAAVFAAAPALAEDAVRHLPARDVPAPDTVSAPMRAVIGAPLQPIWNTHPKDAQEWKAFVAQRAAPVLAALPELRRRLGVTVTPTAIGGVNAFTVMPEIVAPENRDRLLVHVHGGGYVLAPGEAGTREAVLMAGYGRIKVISIDYRMPPDAPYPAAMDDAMAVWREVVKSSTIRRSLRSSAPRPAAA